jgi:hypothetical protein
VLLCSRGRRRSPAWGAWGAWGSVGAWKENGWRFRHL